MLEPATLLIGVSVTSLLAFVVFIRNRRSITNQLFVILSAALVGWSVTTYFSLHTTSDSQTLVWIRWIMFFVVVQNTSFFFLVRAFPETNFRLFNRKRYTAIFVYSVITAFLAFSPYLFTDFVNGAPVPGPGMIFFMLHATLFISAGILLVMRYRKAKGVVKAQLGFFLAGTVFMFTVLPIGNFLIPVFLKFNRLVFLSPLYSIVFTGCIAYAIIKHRLLDIRLLIARAVSYALLIVLFAVMYALVFALASTLLITPYLDATFVAITTVAALFMLVTFPIMKRFIEKATDAVFYKDKYDASQVLYHLAQIMARALRLEDLAHQLLSRINHEMRILHSCIVLLDKGKVFTVMTDGYDEPPEVPQFAASFLTAHGKTMEKDEKHPVQISTFFDALDASVILPLVTSKGPVGLLCLGGKRSGEPYTPEDIETLEIVAPEMAVAIENALSYEEIRRFNVTLEEEVDRATGELKRVNKKLTELDKLKDEFVSLASHELRTPLTSIRSYLWMALSGKGGEVSEKQKYYLDRAFYAADRLIRLVNDMLNISRIESGRMGVQLVRTDVATMFSEILPEIQPKIDEQGITLRSNIPKDLPDVIADTDKIKEVFINLIGNAVKFTPAGGVITVSAQAIDSQVRVTVTDTGTGFEPAAAEKLFSKFSTLHNESFAHPNAFQSTGLGLYISKSIITMHGGSISAYSDGVGKGAAFAFTLPQYSASKREALQAKYVSEGLGIIHSV